MAFSDSSQHEPTLLPPPTESLGVPKEIPAIMAHGKLRPIMYRDHTGPRVSFSFFPRDIGWISTGTFTREKFCWYLCPETQGVGVALPSWSHCERTKPPHGPGSCHRTRDSDGKARRGVGRRFLSVGITLWAIFGIIK